MHRVDLQRVLLEHAGRSVVHAGHRCMALDPSGGGVRMRFENGREIEAELVLGCDGPRAARFFPRRGSGSPHTRAGGVTKARLSGIDEGHVTRKLRALHEYDRRRLDRTRRLIIHSRRYGRIAQWQQPVAAWMRNFVVKHLPATGAEREMNAILDVHFEPIRSPG